MLTRIARRCLVMGLLFLLTAPALRVWAQDEPASPQARTEALLDQAKKAGGKGQLPQAWRDLDSRFKTARDEGASPEQWAVLEQDATLLLNKATFVSEMRRQKSGLEALLGRYDQSLREVAALFGVTPDPVLTGSAAAADLLDRLNTINYHRQVRVDSLSVVNRRLQEQVGGTVAAQDSLISALTQEISGLRQKLWETELRAGVAEADRSAAESVLTKKQAREAAIATLRTSIGPGEGEILLTADGAILMRLHGMAFAVGSAELKPGQEVLIQKVADAIQLFPGAGVRVEGNTDDTGSRQANLRLSRRRAETVAELLETRLDLSTGVIAREGFGPDRPIALNDTAEGRAQNRRIDVVLTPGPK